MHLAHQVRRLVLAVGLCLSPGATVGAAPPGPALTETVLVDRVVWPVRFQPGRGGSCDAITPADAEVLEDGVPVRVTEIAPHRLPTAHILLIDTSGSMMSVFEAARRAAARYVQALPAGDRVALATFDENLRLELAPTGDHRAALSAVDRVVAHGSRYTSLWDAVYNLVSYMEDTADRVVLVVVSDGCDSMSLPWHTYETTRDRIRRSAGLTLLAVAVGRTGTCPRTMDGTVPLSSRTYLESLARQSGGELFTASSGKALIGAFDDLIARLKQEGSVVWSGVPFGQGPKDRPEGNDSRWRKVEVRSRLRRQCRITSAGPPSRLVTRDGQPASPRAARARLHVDGLRLDGVVDDTILARGPLYDAARARTTGLPVTLDRHPRVVTRAVQARLPPFDAQATTPPDPARHLLDLARDALAAVSGDGAETSWPPRPLIHGQTFFAIRESLARALLTAPGYGSWARARIRRDRRQHADRLLAAAAAKGPVSEAASRRVRQAILERPVESREVLRYLGAWLGDVDATAALGELEVQAANEPTGRLAADVRRAWPLLHDWFGPPTAWRAVATLRPAFDPVRDAVGFWRFHLPRPVAGVPPPGLIPARPVALDVLSWLARHDLLAGAATRPVPIRSVRYRPASGGTQARFRDWLWRRGFPSLVRVGDPVWTLRITLGRSPPGPTGAATPAAGSRFELLFFLRPDALGPLRSPDAPVQMLDAEGRDRYDLDSGPFCFGFPDVADGAEADDLVTHLVTGLQRLDRNCGL
ncbi:MAG: VWA domain-containing protein [Acidobacteriota bacterium]